MLSFTSNLLFSVTICGVIPSAVLLPFASGMGFLDIDDLKNSQFDISIQSKPVLLHSSHWTDEEFLSSDNASESPESSSDLPENSPENSPETSPENLPDNSPENSPDNSPDASPESSPDSTSDDSPNPSQSESTSEKTEIHGSWKEKREESGKNSIVLSSKYGQLYQCSLPEDPMESDIPSTEDDSSMGSVVKLLAPMKDGPCLFYTKGWWSYEFCYGREVKQYHFESGAIKGEVISLGKFQSDYDWDKMEEWEANLKKSTKKRKHHSQYYVDGSTCDLSGEARKTEVRFKCDEALKGTDREIISEIEEPSSCTYLFTVSTIRLCSHPRFREEKVKKAKAISCSPALTKTEFQKYVKLQETTAKRVKEMGQRLRNLNAKYMEKLQQKRVERKKASVLDAIDKKGTGLSEKIERKNAAVLDAIDKKGTEFSPDVEKFFKEVYSPKKLKTNPDGSSGNAKEEDEEEVEEDEDDDMKAFKEETKKLEPKDFDTAKESIASTLKGQFQEIYEEAKEELEKETGKELDDASDQEKAALETLTKTLNKLLDQLDKTEKQLDSTARKVGQSVEEKRDKWWRRHYESTSMETNKEEGQMKMEEEEKLSKWIQDTMDKESGDKEVGSSSTDNLVKVRISKLSKSADRKGSQPISIDAKDEKKLSKAVQEELEKAGLLDTQGRQVEVRIVTAGFFEDEDEDGVHTLSSGDSTQFRSLLSSLLGANSQQITEEYRKTQMKSNYKFVWTGDQLEEEEEEKQITGKEVHDEL